MLHQARTSRIKKSRRLRVWLVPNDDRLPIHCLLIRMDMLLWNKDCRDSSFLFISHTCKCTFLASKWGYPKSIHIDCYLSHQITHPCKLLEIPVPLNSKSIYVFSEYFFLFSGMVRQKDTHCKQHKMLKKLTPCALMIPHLFYCELLKPLILGLFINFLLL